MAARPTVLPRWARTTGGVDSSAIVAPTSGEQDAGLAPAQKWTAQKANWLLNAIWKWVLYLSDGVFVSAGGSGLAGLDATGDGAAPGVKATAGGGAAPAQGALGLTPQKTPTAPLDGQIWIELQTGLLKWKGNGLVQYADAWPGGTVEGFEGATFPPSTTPGWSAPSARFASDSAWVRSTSTPIIGAASASAPTPQALSTNSSMGLETYLVTPARCAFVFKLKGNPGATAPVTDYLNFYVDGVLHAQFQSRTGPTSEWGRFVSDVLREGPHTFDWRWIRGSPASVASEECKVDKVEVVSEAAYTSDLASRGYFFSDMIDNAGTSGVPIGLMIWTAGGGGGLAAISSNTAGTMSWGQVRLSVNSSLSTPTTDQSVLSHNNQVSGFSFGWLPFTAGDVYMESRIMLDNGVAGATPAYGGGAVGVGINPQSAPFYLPIGGVGNGNWIFYDYTLGNTWRIFVNGTSSVTLDTGIVVPSRAWTRLGVSWSSPGALGPSAVFTVDGKAVPGAAGKFISASIAGMPAGSLSDLAIATVGAGCRQAFAITSATPFATGGTLATGTWRVGITAITPQGESMVTGELTAAVTGPNGRIDLVWTAAPGATAYRIYANNGGPAGSLQNYIQVGNVTTASLVATPGVTGAGIYTQTANIDWTRWYFPRS
jgi:hypothetical protein